MKSERPADTRDLEERLRDHYRDEVRIIPDDPGLWERLEPRLAPRRRQCWPMTGFRGLPVRMLGAAAALVLVASTIFWISRGSTVSTPVPGLAVPTTAPAATSAPGTGDGGVAPVPPPGAPTAFPGAQAAAVAAPDLTPKPPYEVLDQGIRFAVLRAIVNPGHVTAFFFAVSGPADLAGWTIMPADFRVLDQDGVPYASHIAHLNSVADVTVGAFSIGPLRPNSTDLTVLATTFRATSPNGQERTIRGQWQIHLLENLRSVSIHPDSLAEASYIPCFQSNGVDVGSSFYDPCAKPAVPPTAAPATRPVAVAPTVQVPFPGSARTPTPIPAGHVAPVPVTPAPTRPPTPPVAPTPLIPATPTAVPTPLAPSSPPRVAPAHRVTPAVPLPTATPARLVGGEFLDWRHGFFGVALTVSAPRPHRVFVLVKPDGTVEAVSEATFDVARDEHSVAAR